MTPPGRTGDDIKKRVRATIYTASKRALHCLLTFGVYGMHSPFQRTGTTRGQIHFAKLVDNRWHPAVCSGRSLMAVHMHC